MEKKFCGMHRIPNGFKISFFPIEIYFSWFIFIDKYLKFKEIEYLIHYVKSEMWPALFYVNSFCFEQWNSNWDVAYFNSSLDSKFWNVDLRLYFGLFPNSQKDWKLEFLNVALIRLLSFSQFMKEIEN